jgi:Arc/MetJ-type ribon-helix-helix transcriptional regulator
MPTKVNVVLDDDVKADLEQLVASGKRSRVINTALRRELLALRREKAVHRLDGLRRATRPVSTATLVRELRRDRRR